MGKGQGKRPHPPAQQVRKETHPRKVMRFFIAGRSKFLDKTKWYVSRVRGWSKR